VIESMKIGMELCQLLKMDGEVSISGNNLMCERQYQGAELIETKGLRQTSIRHLNLY